MRFASLPHLQFPPVSTPELLWNICNNFPAWRVLEILLYDTWQKNPSIAQFGIPAGVYHGTILAT